MKELTVSSPAFAQGGLIPVVHTGHGEDISPALVLEGLDTNAKSIAVLLDDMSLPVPAYNHWVIWNLPVRPHIPANIPHGEYLEGLGGAVQGIGYGKHRYRGPKPPFRWSHIYRFTVYVLSERLDLPERSKKRDLLQAMQGKILQEGMLSGHYR